ncbi:DNA replication and repair protein RecF [Alphaproteobacteria bacterium]
MITNITLANFRNHAYFTAYTDAHCVVISGLNGSGKTSILEAISLLIPGKGLRATNLSDVTRVEACAADNAQGNNVSLNRSDSLYSDVGGTLSSSISFAKISAAKPIKQSGWQSRFYIGNYHKTRNVTRDTDSNIVECAYSAEKHKKMLTRDGTSIQNVSKILDLIKVIWLTPEMDNLFLSAASGRRRFLDRMVYSLSPMHANHCIQYNYYLKSRLQLLKTINYDEKWLDSVEKSLSELAVVIALHRLSIVKIMNTTLLNFARKNPFAAAKLEIKGEVECIASEALEHFDIKDILLMHSLSLDDKLQHAIYCVQQKFRNKRRIDAINKQSTFGVQRTDLVIFESNKNMAAHYCSTGEQKSLLISLILAQAEVVVQYAIKHSGLLLLLDDVFSHLDKVKQEALLSHLNSLPIQIWVTTVDRTCHNLLERYIPNTLLIAL